VILRLASRGKNRGQRSVGSKERVETNERTRSAKIITFRANTVGKHPTVIFTSKKLFQKKFCVSIYQFILL